MMNKLIPVDHDPFAPTAQHELVPVDHDPFAPVVTPGGGLNGATRIEPASSQPSAMHSLVVGAQGAARSIADTVGLVPDVVNIATNAALTGADLLSRKLGGPELSYRFPMASDAIAANAENVAKGLGIPVADPEKMSERERLAYNVNRFGGQGALTAGIVAPIAAARGASAASRLPQLGDSLLRPYATAPTAMAVGDTIAGAGGGAGLTAAQSAPQPVRDAAGGLASVFLDLAGMGAGQLGGGTLAATARGPNYVKDAVTRNSIAREIPLDAETQLPTKNAVADRAAAFVQTNASDPERAAKEIAQAANSYRDLGVPIPAAGALSNDPKIMAVERGQRRQNPSEFVTRDIALRDAAVDLVERMRPDADPRKATDFVAAEVRNRRLHAERGLSQSEASLESANNTERSLADVLRAFGGKATPASEALDKLIVEKSLRPMDEARRADYAAIPRDVGVPNEPFSKAAASIRSSAEHLPENARSEVLPTARLEDFENMARGDETAVQFGTVNDMRPILSSDIARARSAGAPPSYIQNLEKLRGEINSATEAVPEAVTANNNYRDIYAPVWGRGAGEAYALRQDIGKDAQFRTAAPPSATASRFLGTGPGAKENAEALSRIVASIPNPADRSAATGAVRDYVMDQMTRTVGVDGKINPQQLARFLNGPSGWNDALARFPEIQTEAAKLLSDAQKGRLATNEMGAAVERASANLKRTEDDIRNSALSLVIGREPTKAAKAVLDSKDPKRAMAEVVGTIGHYADAKVAWERAVTDHLIDRITKVDPSAVSAGNRSIDYGKLIKTFDHCQDALAELYKGEPDKMNALRRAQKLLEPLAHVPGPANVNLVPPSESVAAVWKALEVGLKGMYGVLKGGGLVRTLKIAASVGADDTTAANRLITRMMFDPELAQHLLTRPVKDVGGPAYNARLARLLRRVEVGREVFGTEE